MTKISKKLIRAIKQVHSKCRPHYSTMFGTIMIALITCTSSVSWAWGASKITTIAEITSNLNTWLGGDLKKTVIYILGISVTVTSAIRGAWTGVVTGVVIIIFNILLQSYINGL